MDQGHLLQMIQQMLVGFKHDIAKMRSEGASQAEIDLMLDEFEKLYRSSQVGCSPQLCSVVSIFEQFTEISARPDRSLCAILQSKLPQNGLHMHLHR